MGHGPHSAGKRIMWWKLRYGCCQPWCLTYSYHCCLCKLVTQILMCCAWWHSCSNDFTVSFRILLSLKLFQYDCPHCLLCCHLLPNFCQDYLFCFVFVFHPVHDIGMYMNIHGFVTVCGPWVCAGFHKVCVLGILLICNFEWLCALTWVEFDMWQ